MIKNYNTIDKDLSLTHALEYLSKAENKCLFVLDKKKSVIGTLTDGDVRRSLIKSKDLNNKVGNICNKKFLYFKKDVSKSKIYEIFLKKRTPLIPLLQNKKIVKVYFLDEILNNKKSKLSNNSLKNLEVAVMAGGKGQRLNPFSEVLPKPLIPINGKPVIDHLIENFLNIGVKKIYVTVNYKKNIIKSYLQDQFKNAKITYIEEKKPLGTASSLGLLKKDKEKNLLVINCDTILNINYDKLLDYHINQKNDFTVVAAFKKITVPYGVCEIDKKQILKKIIEKPSTNNLVIVGAYCFKNKLIKHIPKNIFFNMNDFIKKLMIKKYKVGIYPISELDWQDVGEWPEYFKTISNFKSK
jgi:dTDP-glucose pyrophosphorylase